MILDIHAVKRRYDIAPEDEPKALQYLKALKYIIGADGEIADAEWKALKHWMQRMHIPKKLVREVEKFEVQDMGLEDIIPSIKKDGLGARTLIKDAIEIARADGTYAKEENDAVNTAAALLGVKPETVGALESLVEMEGAVAKLKSALLGSR